MAWTGNVVDLLACYTCHPFFLALCEFSQASPEEWPMAWSFPSNMRPGNTDSPTTARWQFPKVTINQMDPKLDKFHSEITKSMSQNPTFGWFLSFIVGPFSWELDLYHAAWEYLVFHLALEAKSIPAGVAVEKGDCWLGVSIENIHSQ